MKLGSNLGGAGPIVIVLLALSAPISAHAIGSAESDDGEYSIDAVGNLRFTGAFMHFPDVPELYATSDDALLATVARLLLEGDLGPRLDYEVNLFGELTRSPLAASGAFSTAGSFDSPYRSPHLVWDYWETDAVHGQLGVDRLILSLRAAPLDVSIGRLPVNYAVTQIFAPNDFFAPFSATAINKLYKPGVDAVRLSWATGMLSTVELVYALGAGADGAPGWAGSALLLRAGTVALEYEVALLGGKLAERWVVGASLQGPAGPLSLRAEGHLGLPDHDGRGGLDDPDGDGRLREELHARLAVGCDVTFPWRNSVIAAEYLYVSDGADDPAGYLARATRYFPDDLAYLGRHYAGLTAGGELTPLLRLQLVGLLNLEDRSGLGSLMLVYSLSDEAELVGGVLLPWGEAPGVDALGMPVLESEFGAAPITAFLETRFYF